VIQSDITQLHGRHLTFSDWYSFVIMHIWIIARKQDAEIKAALFRFITDTNRKL